MWRRLIEVGLLLLCVAFASLVLVFADWALPLSVAILCFFASLVLILWAANGAPRHLRLGLYVLAAVPALLLVLVPVVVVQVLSLLRA
jgi:hypothetical protein